MILVILFFLILPLAAAGLTILLWRSAATRSLALALLLSGITGAAFAALYAFSVSSVPIAPYELGRGAWLGVIEGVLVALYVGFGLGVLVSSFVVLPLLFFRSLARRRKLSDAESTGTRTGGSDAR